MGETKNMHYVPKTYLKRFAKEEIKAGTKQYYTYILHKSLKSGIERRKIRSICAEDNLYIVHGETEEERMLVETMYKELYEDGYDTLYNLLIDSSKETITAQERYAIVGFIVSIFYRNNAWNNFYNNMMDDIYNRAYHLSIENGQQSFFFENQEISIAGKSLKQLQEENRNKDREMIALTISQRIFALIRLRVQNDFISIVKARPGYEFITSDNPVTFKSKDTLRRPIPFDPDNSLWLPIDSQHLLQINPWAGQLDWTMIGRLSDPWAGMHTSMNNAFQRQQCQEYLIGSQSGLAQFQQLPHGILTEAINREAIK